MKEKDTEQVQRTNVEQIQRSTSEQVQRLTKEEHETACVYNETDGYWTIYTGVQSHIRKFDKLNYPATYIDYYPDGEVAGKFYQVPKNAISFKSPKKREYSEEQKQEMIQRLKQNKT